MALTTLAEVKAFLGITDNTQDALLTMFKDSVEQSIINYCETDFTDKTVSGEILDGEQGDIIVPKGFPILSVQSVTVGVEVDGSGGTVLGALEYYFDSGAIFLRHRHTPFARGVVKVAYHWGYTAVPADVKMVVYQSVKAEMQRYAKNSEDVLSRSKEGESETLAGAAVWDALSGLPKSVLGKLQPYKLIEFSGAGFAQRNL